MPNGDEYWNNQEWFRHLDSKLDKALDKKSDKEDCAKDTQRHETRIDRLDDKHSHLAVKVAGIAGGISLLVGIAGWVFGG